MSTDLNLERLLTTIESPYLSEKSAIATEKNNVYTFKVARNASKGEIKNAVEKLLNAKVKTVTTLNTKSKTKTFRGKKGNRQSWKKAYVTLQADSKIDIATE